MAKELCQTCRPDGKCWYEQAKIETLALARETVNTHGLKKKQFANQGVSLVQAEAIAIGCKEVQRDLELPKLPTRNARRK